MTAERSLAISTDAKYIGNCDSYDLQFINMELRNTLDKHRTIEE